MAKKVDGWLHFHDKYVELQEKHEKMLRYTIDLQKRHIEVIDEQIGILQGAAATERALKRILAQPGCNDCALSAGNQCGIAPAPGEDIRINCYKYKAKGENHDG